MLSNSYPLRLRRMLNYQVAVDFEVCYTKALLHLFVLCRQQLWTFQTNRISQSSRVKFLDSIWCMVIRRRLDLCQF